MPGIAPAPPVVWTCMVVSRACWRMRSHSARVWHWVGPGKCEPVTGSPLRQITAVGSSCEGADVVRVAGAPVEGVVLASSARAAALLPINKIAATAAVAAILFIARAAALLPINKIAATAAVATYAMSP